VSGSVISHALEVVGHKGVRGGVTSDHAEQAFARGKILTEGLLRDLASRQ
jgi:hypothetical protein